jgi:predicted ArsR family transcriptional regulator
MRESFSDKVKAILRAGKAMTLAQMAAELETNTNTLQWHINQMHQRGELTKHQSAFGKPCTWKLVQTGSLSSTPLLSREGMALAQEWRRSQGIYI